MADDLGRLTAAVAAGDSGAIAAFYAAWFDWLYTEARRVSRRDEAFCLDVVQDATLRIVRCIRRIEAEGQLKAWLRLVVRSTTYDLLRAERRRTKHAEVLAAMGPETAEAPDHLEWLAEQLKRLDPRIVQLIDLRYREGWSLRRMAEHLGLSVGTIDGRLRRALKELRGHGEEPGE